MSRLRSIHAGLLSAALVLAACDGSGEHNNPDEASQGAPGADSVLAGTDVPNSAPPVGTVNPAAPSGPGTYGDSASPAAVGGPTPTGAPDGPVQPATATEKAGDDSPEENP